VKINLYNYSNYSIIILKARRPPMPYTPIEINRRNITIMGVNFSSVNNFEAEVNVLGTVMFEGFDPTTRGIEIIRDYLSDKITLGQLIQLTRDKAYA
jgi:putative transcriptional regulator